MGFLKTLAKRFAALVNADVRYEDESNQFCIMLRICQIMLIVYMLLFELLTFLFWKGGNPYLVLPWIAIIIGGFWTTYQFRTRVVFHLFSCLTIVWIWLFVHYFGWDVGAQHFLFPLLVVSFFATYDNIRGKTIYTLVLLAFRLYLFLYVSEKPAMYPLEHGTQSAFQILNMVALFSIMFYVCWTFSNTNQEAQKKLAYYNKRLKHEARTDALTGLWNRRSMLESLEKRVSGESQEFLSVAIGDIDFFKRVNDTRGHNCGDEVLRRLGALFAEFMQDKGLVCRWGGEEFFLAFSTNGDIARAHIDDLRERIQGMEITDPSTGEIFHITMTFGVEEYDFSSTVTELIRRADDKLYAGKDSGRNCTVY